MRWLIVLILTIAHTGGHAVVANAEQPDPFVAADGVPADVSLYLHVADAAELRRRIADRPLRRWFSSLLQQGQIARMWDQLAHSAGLEPEAFFDRCFGRGFTLINRAPPGTASGVEGAVPVPWVLVTDVEPEEVRPVLRSLRLKHLSPRSGRAVAELPEQELLFCIGEHQLMIGPKPAPELFWELLPHLGDPLARSLADSEPIARAKGLGSGRVGLMIRHNPPLGGWSVAVADLQGEHATIRHAGSFDSPPFERSMTGTTWDPSPLEAFEDSALLVVMEPTDVGGGSTAAYLQSVVGEPLIDEEMQANLGETRIFALGEVEGRLQENPVDLLPATLAVIFKLKDSRNAEHHLDCSMFRLSRRLNELCDGTLLAGVPRRRDMLPGEPRSIKLNPSAELFGGAMPVMQHVSLNWAVAQNDDAGYYVIASHPDQLQAALKALKQKPARKPAAGRYTSCGFANGPRLGVHLRSYSDQASLFTGEDPADAAQFRQTMLLLSELASGIHRCHWRLARPSVNEMTLDLDLILSPPETVR
ncbi:MAG: hypothetical protein JSV91_16130 [Phycisphaerales bacterium]|nr:MAG: hypothetical protein JSV91_16130 [Phycisphaerales bacterium]